MSYILEALRKSDQQRQRELGAVPTLHAPQPAATSPKTRDFPVNVWLAVLLIGAGIAIGWLQPWRTPSPPPVARPMPAQPASVQANVPVPTSAANMNAVRHIPAQASGAAKPDTSSAIAAGQALSPRLAQAPLGPQGPPTEAGDVTKAASNDAVPTHSRSVRPQPFGLAQQRPVEGPGPDAAKTTTGRSNGPAVGTQPEAKQGKPVLSLQELPASIRQVIPKLTIAFHVYAANPDERRVMLNNVMLRQGESLSPGLEVDEITPDGVIMRYQGYRFRHEVR
jgi:general secretion pathway protein B